ncbi:MAG: hypothetical protein IKF38_00050 [Clostridia bacterium]|nr:hypothetical protein [Clostridia bacterium]
MIRKVSKIVISIIMTMLILLNYSIVNAAPSAPPDGGKGSAPGGNSSSSNVSHTGATTISSDTNNNGETYSSTTGSQNALLVNGGTSSISNTTVTKTGDASGDNADFYGTNAGVLVKDGTLNIDNANITTNGSHANAVFAYSSGIINISDSTIKTTSNNSGAVMVTGGGTLTANNVTAETDGNSSAPIRSDRGGGTLTVNEGNYTSHGTGSPVIYSTADITVNDATLTSTASEGVVVEGKNSVTLNNVTMEATNTKLNGNSETYKSIFIYQSMSGDADVGTSEFTAKNSKIINNKGEIIFVTNTSTVINLENNEIINNDSTGGFLKIGAAKWGTSGKNGGDVTLNASNQTIDGNIYVDNISSLKYSLLNGSKYTGTINADNTAKTLAITLDSSSTLTLTGDSYITALNNEVEDNSNINLNGHTLYVNGKSITSTNYKGNEEESAEITTDTADTNTNVLTQIEQESIQGENTTSPILVALIILVAFLVITIILALIFRKKN